MSELFVYGKFFSRGDESTIKFRVNSEDVLEAAKLFKADDEAVENFLEKKYEDIGASETALFREIIVGGIVGEAVVIDLENGFGVQGEEFEFGVGKTKDAAKLAFVNLERGDDGAGSDEDW
jgi:hypothetical protein